MTLRIHPFAESFPMMSELELDRLAASIKDNGLRRPITKRKSDGMIVDGRNRLEACRRAEVVPVFEMLDLDEVGSINLIADLNIERRHMNESQRGIAAAEYAERLLTARDLKTNSSKSPSPPHRPSTGISETIKEAATKFNVGTTTVKAARKVRSESPEIAAKVQAGEMTLNAAEKRIKNRASASKPKPAKPNASLVDCSAFDAIATEFGKLKRRIVDLSNSRVGIYLNEKTISIDIDNARRSLMFAKPSKKCPHCDNEPSSECVSCKGLGLVTEAMIQKGNYL